ncbi:hypothetical protein ACH5RR_031253 [Cinchona calisaya]|uniref:Uncharacterized protein n=1 Tax=Cinchona calisaya TaxID=153742 RepID=A0ABD2YGN2_9GENT
METLAMELEDDVFFADLSKRISLLIMDDDEDLVTHSPSVSLQAFSQSIIHPAPQTPYVYDQQTCSRRSESKGTGVFIPRSSQPRRKNGQGRYTYNYTNPSTNSKFQRNHDDNNSRGVISHHVSHNTKVSYDSFNPRRF